MLLLSFLLFLSAFLMLYFVLLSDHTYCSFFWGVGRSVLQRDVFFDFPWGCHYSFWQCICGEDREIGPAVSLRMKWRRKTHSRCSMYFAEWRKRGRRMTPGPRGIPDNSSPPGRSSGQASPLILWEFPILDLEIRGSSMAACFYPLLNPCLALPLAKGPV